MVEHSPQEITQLLLAWEQGDQRALDQLIPLVEAELHRLASRYMRRERAGNLLQTTALVNEAYLRLIDQRHAQWQNRAYFFGVAATLMRRILVDFARARQVQKRGGAARQVALDEALVISEERDADLVALDEALAALAAFAPRQARVVELRFFGGLSLVETAECLHVSPDTVTRDWHTAKAWLYRELDRQDQPATR
ncbi:MAG TPA: ECF-type sigma factor [Blastocatellia bacterium]|nr:ECF-type sigma factor [Blastocatellia bacterium]